MAQCRPGEVDDPDDLLDVLDRFDEARRRGTPIGIGEVLDSWAAGPRPAGPAARRELAEELVKVDLEYGWQAAGPGAGGPAGPRLEAYLESVSELGPRDRVSAELIGEEYRVRRRWGDRPGREEYEARFPAQWPALRAILDRIDEELLGGQDAGPGLATETGASQPDRRPPRPPVGSSVAGYELLGELGRGGMGVVYRARRRESNRLVALKMLLACPHTYPEQLARFRAEVVAVARLEHPRIVPILEVGVADGVPFYTMPLIPGRGLDAILKRRIQAPNGGRGVAPDATHPDASPAEDVTTRPATRRPGAASGCPSPGDPAARGWAEDPDGSPGWARLTDEPTSRYVRAVARIGAQAAEALAMAHRHGVLHRDVKPSNLLVDLRGDAWLTDFGLAKVEGVDGPTVTGDLVGTLRYLPPERLAGWSDRRGDVYGLGVTLYEALTLRPAFVATDHARLVEQIAREDPPRPRHLEPRIPPDLEAIILKAIAKEPADRYPTAESLAEDLRRFLAGLPIVTHRPSALDRLRRWCRKNRLVAAMASSTALLLVAVAVVASLAAVRERSSRRQVLEVLHRAYLAQARAGRWSGQSGRRFDGLDVLAKAAAIRPSPELRDEAIACMALPDLRLGPQWESALEEGKGIAVDPSFTRYAASDTRGTIGVVRLADRRELMRLPGDGQPAWELEFSPDGRHVAAIHEGRGRFRVWNLDRRGPVAAVPAAIRGTAWAFAPDGRTLAVGTPDGSVDFFDLDSGKATRRLTGLEPVRLAFDPLGRRLAVSTAKPPGVRIIDPESGEAVGFLGHPIVTDGLAWRSDGQLLAVACGNAVHLWDTRSGERRGILEGHQSKVTHLAFNRRGDLLASHGYDGAVRLWDVDGARLLVSSPGTTWIAFSRDDRYLSGALNGPLAGIWEVATAREFRTLRGHAAEWNGPWTVDYSPDGRLLASAGFDGVRLWDPARSSRDIGLVPTGPSVAARFLPDGRALLTSGASPLLRWPIAPGTQAGAGGPVRLGPRQDLGLPSRHFQNTFSLGRDGRTVGIILSAGDGTGPGSARILNLDRPGEMRTIADPDGFGAIAVSPDGQLVATGPWHGPTTKVWDARTGTLLGRLATGDCFLAFSPDGRWLVTGSSSEYRFWEVGSWRATRVLARSRSTLRGPLAFRRDGRVLAIAHSSRDVQLIDAATGDALAMLSSPDPQLIASLCFSPDGSQLAAACEGHVVQTWDLRAIRWQLATLGLDWEAPSEPPPADDVGPVAVEVDDDPTLIGPFELAALMREKRWPAVVAYFDRRLANDPRQWRLYSQRGGVHSELGRWQEAAADFSRAVEYGGDQTGVWTCSRHALSLLAIGDHRGYRAACRRMLDRLATEPGFGDAVEVLWTCALAPDAVGDPERLVGLAEEAARARRGNRRALLTLGALLYRAGRPGEAIDVLGDAINPNDDEHQGRDRLFLAMAASSREQASLGRIWLRDSARRSGSGADTTWKDRLEYELLRREAGAVLGRSE